MLDVLEETFFTRTFKRSKTGTDAFNALSKTIGVSHDLGGSLDKTAAGQPK